MANKDNPIRTSATIKEKRDDGMTFIVTLPNGKTALGHSQLKHKDYRDSLEIGDMVTVEMTPFDFEKARIIPTPAED
ncbi:translation initiation factor IF-1 [Rubritalea sp.]|uniref:translation initiation factor IF-1 n=1 Tax=Rubritalea sp. TaxID=2109375 RepID=UPI003EF66415